MIQMDLHRNWRVQEVEGEINDNDGLGFTGWSVGINDACRNRSSNKWKLKK